MAIIRAMVVSPLHHCCSSWWAFKLVSLAFGNASGGKCFFAFWDTEQVAMWSMGLIADTMAAASRLETGVECHAAIDVKGDSGHIVGFIGGQPHRCAADIPGLSDPLVGNQFGRCRPATKLNRFRQR